MDFLQLTVCTTTEASDIVASVLMDAGSEGVAIKDSADYAELFKGQIIWDYIDESLLTADKRVYVSGFFDVKADVSQVTVELERLRRNAEFDVGSLELTSSVIKSEDYENVWKQYYKPIEIGKVVIVPQWIKREADGLKEVRIDPGMAFGTGNHETTSMCIRLLNDVELSGKEVCDLGCGSGILGITALKLGAKRCVLSDIDPQAIDAARSNLALNGEEQRAEVLCGDLAYSGTFDVVIANITADILIRLSKKIKDMLRDGSTVIVSGIINARAEEVLAAFGDLSLKKRLRDGEWQAFEFER